MKHKYNIPFASELMSLIGYRGLPFPGAWLPSRPAGTYKGDSQEDYEIETQAPQRKEFVKGTRLYAQDKLGRWYFMPVTIKHPDITANEGSLELQYAVMSITGKKTIVETPLVGQKGSVKELISIEDYKISLAAMIVSEDGTYPDEQITQVKELYNINEAVELVSAFTNLIFDPDDKVVITDISFPPTPGIEDAQAVKLELVTDKPFELTIE